MSERPKNRLQTLQDRLQLQRHTVAALKRDGRECPDAERQLKALEMQVRADRGREAAAASRPGSPFD